MSSETDLSIYIFPPNLTHDRTLQPIRDLWAAALLSGIYKQGHSGAMVHTPDDETEWCAVAVLEYITTNATIQQLQDRSALASNQSYCIGIKPVANTTIFEYHLTTADLTIQPTSFQSLSDRTEFTFTNLASLIQDGYLIWSNQYHSSYPLIRLMEPSHILKPAAVNILDFHSIQTQ